MVATLVVVGAVAAACERPGSVATEPVDPAAQPYVDQAEKILAGLPLFPGSREKQVIHSESHAAECDGAPIDGGSTLHIYAFPNNVSWKRVARFYLTRLPALGWHVTDHEPVSRKPLAGPIFGFAKGDIGLTVNLDNGFLHGFEVGLGVPKPGVDFHC
jgi:hypothetical protein